MSPLKRTVKRGALVAAANWPVTLIQWVGDSLFELLMAVPVIGGTLFVVLVIGAEPAGLMRLGWREMLTTIVATLVSQPIVLAAFLSALGVAVIGGSALMFLIKAGTVATLVAAERNAGPIEQPPLHLSTIARVSQFTPEQYIAASKRLFARYARLGVCLMAVYAASAAAYLQTAVVGRVPGDAWMATALLSALFVGWVTIVNLLYLLIQIVIAADDCGVVSAGGRVTGFLRADFRSVASVFGLVLGTVVLVTGVSALATAALGLIAFVPLQLIAWLLRGLVFQYIGLAAASAYVTLYRRSAATTAP